MVDHDSIINSREQYMEYLPIHKYNSVFVYGILKLFVQDLDLSLPSAIRLTVGLCECLFVCWDRTFLLNI